MPLTKLTLSADRDLIEQAKKLAAAEGTSVSALFSRLLRAMTCTSASREVVGPLTRKATGIIRLPGTAGDERLLEDALARKYAGRKMNQAGSAKTFDQLLPEIRALIQECRVQCLWFLIPEFMPTNPEQALRALSSIERYGDRSAFVRARELRACLLQFSNVTSVD